MSVQSALDFVGKVREDKSLSEKVRELATDTELQAVVDLARREGYSISEGDLREAFKHDWAMRWFRHTGSSS
ncbi:MAG: hypothetical protein BMS9Abin05_0235 [Rhodothermia bacterium]|nr:MAG: hypothetical protein BMS9Abin05_0235 [Rhodothermia bacterium]